MARLFIPTLGTKLTLAEDWTFALHGEHRNGGMFHALGLKQPQDRYGYYAPSMSVPATLPAGTELTVRRIYIRQGQAGFDSVTFSVLIGKRQHRFWVKLEDANSIKFVD